MNTPIKLVVAGHAQHGKDTVCMILKERYGLRFETSSRIALQCIIWPLVTGQNGLREDFEKQWGVTGNPRTQKDLNEMGGMATPQECYARRGEHRGTWYDIICWYNSKDRARLARQIFSQHDVYCGLRSEEELQAIRKKSLADWVVWVKAYPRVEPESKDSCTLTPAMADLILDNTGQIVELPHRIDDMMQNLGRRPILPLIAGS